MSDQDLVSFTYYNTSGAWRNKDVFIDIFDRNSDNAISRLDGAHGETGQSETFSFTNSGLVLEFAGVTFALQGADYLI